MKTTFPIAALDFHSDHSPIHNIAAVMARSYSTAIAKDFIQPIDDHDKIQQIKNFLTNVKNNLPQTDPNTWGHVITHITSDGTIRKQVIAYIPVTWLDIHEDTQRINDKEERKFCNKEKFKSYMADQITLNYRDGRLYIMDGKHRIIGFIFNGILYVQVKIFVGDDIVSDGLTKQDEALFFAEQNKHVSNPSEYQKYAKGLTGQLNDCVMVSILAKKFNLIPSESSNAYGPRTLHSINTLRSIITKCEDNNMQNMPFWMMDILNRSNWFTNNTEPPLTARLMNAFHKTYTSQLRAAGSADIMAKNAVEVLVHLDYETLSKYATKHAGKKDYRSGWNVTINNIVMGILTADMILKAVANDDPHLPEQPAIAA